MRKPPYRCMYVCNSMGDMLSTWSSHRYASALACTRSAPKESSKDYQHTPHVKFKLGSPKLLYRPKQVQQATEQPQRVIENTDKCRRSSRHVIRLDTTKRVEQEII